MPRALELTGQRFGRLTVVERTESAKYGHSRWLCLCDCSLVSVVLSTNLQSGTTQSCGCLAKETAQANGQKNSDTWFREGYTAGVVHGDSPRHGRHYLYECWANMKARCLNPRHPNYPDYGGRGVAVCDEWLEWVPFRDYVEQTLGPRPEGYSLDRIQNDLGYFPNNIRWATRSEQRANTGCPRHRRQAPPRPTARPCPHHQGVGERRPSEGQRRSRSVRRSRRPCERGCRRARGCRRSLGHPLRRPEAGRAGLLWPGSHPPRIRGHHRPPPW